MPATDPSDGATFLQRRGPVALFALAVAFGTLVRLDQIGVQIPGDDEWHALHAVRDHDAGWIFRHFGLSDHGIPTALYDAVVAGTVGLSELWLRAPMLLAGIAALVLLPLLLRESIGRTASALFAWLLAISPLHVYFSRYARPYSPAFLCAVLSTIAFDRWRRTRRRRWAAAFVACAVLAAWLHPVFLPFVLAPFAGIAVRAVLRRRSTDRPPEAAVDARPGPVWPLALGTALGLLALLGPPFLADRASLAARSEGARPSLAPPVDVFELLSGANRPVLAFAFGVAVVLGLVAMRGRWRGVPGWLLFASACQAAVLLAVGPAEIGVPITTARYLLPALALLLLLAAVGLEHLDALLKKEWRRFPRHGASAVVGLALLVYGPLPAVHYRPNDFTNHTAFQYDHDPNFPHNFATRNFQLKGLSKFYLQLAEEPADGGCIVEAPWYYEWHRQPFALYQKVHRWPVLVGFVAREDEPLPLGELRPGDPRFRFRSFVHVADLERLRARGVRYVVFHRDPPRKPADDLHPSIADALHWIAVYEERVGPPVFTDDDLTVFDLQNGR